MGHLGRKSENDEEGKKERETSRFPVHDIMVA